MSSFALIQEEFEDIRPEALGPLLQKHISGVFGYDAMRMARERRGLVAYRLTQDQAEWIEYELRHKGINTKRIHQEEVVNLERPQRVRLLRLNDDCLQVFQGYTSQAHEYRWDQVWLLSACEVVGEPIENPSEVDGFLPKLQTIDFGAPAYSAPHVAALIETRLESGPLPPLPESQLASEARHFQADLMIEGCGVFYQFRLASGDLYDDQILGAEAIADPRTNFCRILAKIAKRAKRAKVNPGLRFIALGDHDGHTSPLEGRFPNAEEFGHYSQWQLQMLKLWVDEVGSRG